MTFLNSAILAALTLGLLPILIHLLNRQRFKKVDFPTLRFLRELQRQKMRQVRIRQWLLLALRTLAVLFLVLALARPVLKSSAGILPGAKARTTAVLVLDRSASMQAEIADGTRFRQLQMRVQEILSLMQDGDDAQIIWADDPPEVFPENPTAQFGLLRETVVHAIPTSCGGDLVQALQLARSAMGRSQNLHKEIYILSDFSASAWPEKLPENELLPKDVRVLLVPTMGSTIRNIGVVDAQITSRIITPAKPVEVSFTVLNSGTTAVEDRIVSVYLGGRRVAQTRMTLAAGESRTQRLKFVPDAPGDQTGIVRVEEADDFPLDDQRYFVLRVPSHLTVAVVGNNGPARDFTALALNPAADPGAFITTVSLTTAQLETEDWSELDAIMIVDAGGFSSGFPSRLRTYVDGGRGVLVMPGPQADLQSYAAWLPAIGLPIPTEVWDGTGSTARWKQTDLQHPLFEGLFEERPTNISPEFSHLFHVQPSGSALEIFSTSAGMPGLLESKIGRGRALFLTGSPDPSWSTLFRSGIFPPLMVSSAAYLSGIGTSGTDYQLTAGKPTEWQFQGIPGGERSELRGEQIISPIVEPSAAGFALKIPGLNKTGAYDLWQGSRKLAAAAVNPPARESNLQPVADGLYQKFLGGQTTFFRSRASIQATILEGRFGRELWKYCLGIALLSLIAEMLIGRAGKRDIPTT
jgi:hypothetical protein